MKNNILKEFKENSIKVLGHDGKYHTVYYIEFETGHYYIGKHSTENIEDSYFCSGKLANYMKYKNIKYKRDILYYVNSAQLAIDLETRILQTKKIYDNELCLNCYPGSPNDLTGTIIISKGNIFKMINPKLLEVYLEDGWEKKGVKRVAITNGNDSKFILPDDVEIYLENGWEFGSSVIKNRVFIEKDNIRKYIRKEFLDDYLKEGWVKKHNIEGRRVMRKGNIIVKVPPEKINEKIKEGFELSSICAGLISLKKDNDYKSINKEELEQHLREGWVRGNNHTGKIYINDGNIEFRIFEGELHNYPNCEKGRLKKIYLNNGIIEKRVHENKNDLISSLINDGFVIGKLTRPKKILVYKNGKKKYILPEELSTYLDLEWSNIYSPTRKANP